MSSSGRRCGLGGAGGSGGGRDERLRAWSRSVGAKRRVARKWSNWEMVPPTSLRDYAPGGRYYDELPEMPADGEGSSSGAARGALELRYARDDDEERAYVAKAVANSEASLADEAFKAREEEERPAKHAALRIRDYADQ